MATALSDETLAVRVNPMPGKPACATQSRAPFAYRAYFDGPSRAVICFTSASPVSDDSEPSTTKSLTSGM